MGNASQNKQKQRELTANTVICLIIQMYCMLIEIQKLR